jgi:hypothetical protein
MANDHFVPRHYLRQFTFRGSELICTTRIDPYRFLGKKGIGGQCCEDDYYESNEGLNKLLWTSENDMAPVLVNVCKREDFDTKEIVALKLLAITLYLRTRKAVERAKVFPKFMAKEVIGSAVRRGELPPPPEGEVTEDLFDFSHVAGTVMQAGAIPCWMESQTLAAKLLRAEAGAHFITSDNPVAILNQFCVGADKIRTYAGFSRSGFQLLLPMSPKLCLIVYDGHVYKVGGRRRRLVEISKADVEIVNSLQVQAAENCLYFHEPTSESSVQQLVTKYARLRVPLREYLQTLPGRNANEELIHLKHEPVKLPNRWRFCGYRRNINSKPGDRRDPAWSALTDELIKDLEQHPTGEDLFGRLDRLTGGTMTSAMYSFPN